jgi:hypothetical protein
MKFFLVLRRFSSVPNRTDFLRVPFVSSVVALVLVFGCGDAALCLCGEFLILVFLRVSP